MRWSAVVVIALVVFSWSSTPAEALAITGNFLSATSATGPDNQAAEGGGNIQDIFDAAASYRKR